MEKTVQDRTPRERAKQEETLKRDLRDRVYDALARWMASTPIEADDELRRGLVISSLAYASYHLVSPKILSTLATLAERSPHEAALYGLAALKSPRIHKRPLSPEANPRTRGARLRLGEAVVRGGGGMRVATRLVADLDPRFVPFLLRVASTGDAIALVAAAEDVVFRAVPATRLFDLEPVGAGASPRGGGEASGAPQGR